MYRIRWLQWLIPVAAAWGWWCTLQATAWDRIRSFSCVENYALAVYNQLVWNYSSRGIWEQTIHHGYVDHWMWSGHRSLWLWAVAAIYPMDPEPLLLCRVQIALVALGAIPAYGLARHVFGGRDLSPSNTLQGIAGGIFGIALYLGYPPLLAIALNDYQDLILGIPFALAAIWASRAGSLPGFLLAAFACCAAREEWALVMPLIGLSYPGPLRDRAKQIGWGVGLSAFYGLLISWLGRDFAGHDNPMSSQLGGMLREGLPPITRTASDFKNFYAQFLLPLQFFGLFAPLTLLPLSATLLIHIFAPASGGVDAQWLGHIHHMSPTGTFAVAAAIEGVGWLFSRIQNARWRPRVAVGIALMAVIITMGACQPWIRYLKLNPQFTPALRSSPADAPELALLAQVPENASIAVDVHTSLMPSSRARAFTYDDSLEDKRPKKGLSVVEYMLVKKADTEWLGRAQQVSGAEQIGETQNYALFRFPKTAANTVP